jgi:hypothetical protein
VDIGELPVTNKQTDTRYSTRKCCKKVKYFSREKAERALLATKIVNLRCQFRGTDSRRRERAIYRCPLKGCVGVWHLTSKSQERYKEKKHAIAA